MRQKGKGQVKSGAGAHCSHGSAFVSIVGVSCIRILTLCITASAALAAPCAAQDREAARAAYEEGARQFEAGNHQLALESFLRVRELLRGDPRAQALALYNIARSYDELGRFEDALRVYEQYLAEAPSDAPNREQTLDRVRELRSRVGAARAEAEPAPAQRGASGSVLVPVGIAVAAVGGAALLAAIPTGVLALDREAELEATCEGGRCPQSAQGTLDEAYLLGTLTDVLWIAGLSVAAVGAALVVVGVVSEHEAGAVGAACTGEGCVATLRASF